MRPRDSNMLIANNVKHQHLYMQYTVSVEWLCPTPARERTIRVDERTNEITGTNEK